MGHFFIDRPIVAIVISIVTVIAGLVMITRLPIAQYPEIVPPIIQVKTTYTGADALAVEESVATPIEQQVNGVQNMIYMKSINGSDGTLTLQVSFEVGTESRLKVFTQNRLAQATSQLPTAVVEFGTTVQQTVGLPLLVIPIYSPNGSYDAAFLGNYANINVIDQLARVPGVGQVVLFGTATTRCASGCAPTRWRSSRSPSPTSSMPIKAQNVVNPAGQVGAEPAPKGQEFTYTVTAQGRLVQAEQFGEIIVRANPDGSFVRLRDVARIELGSQTYMQLGRFQGKPAAVVCVYQAPGSNALATADALKTQMAEMAARFPADVAYDVALDTTLPVSEGITEIVHTLCRSDGARHHRRLSLPPGLARDADPADRGAGLAGRRLHLLPDARLLDQYALAARAGARDRSRRRRRDRGRRGGRVSIEHGLSPRDATIKAMDEVSGP